MPYTRNVPAKTFITSLLIFGMRIAIFSDLHLGFGYGTERYDDTFNAFKEALDIAKGSDLVIIPGDIFDTKNPTTDSLSKAMEMLLDLRMSQTGAKLVEGMGRKISELSPVNTMGVPVIALHGNHERRAKGFVNPVQALEKAGLLIHVHCNGLVFEKDGKRVAIQGMSAVPDQFAKEVLEQWSPMPMHGAFNILLVHQLFTEFFQSGEGLSTSTLPEGFDLYIDGDIHKPSQGKYKEKPFIVSGSLVPTQLNKDEAIPKGVWVISTDTGSIQFRPLQKQRAFHFLDYKTPNREVIQQDIEKVLAQPHDKPPIIRVKLLEDFKWQSEIETRFKGKALLSFRKKTSKTSIEGISLADHITSVEETASRLLRKNLAKEGLDPKSLEHVFELLAEKRRDDALELVKDSVQKTPKKRKKKTTE